MTTMNSRNRLTTSSIRYRLRYGGLTQIIIATVGEHNRITPRDLADELNDRGLRVTAHQMSARLAELASEGRLARVGKGAFAAV